MALSNALMLSFDWTSQCLHWTAHTNVSFNDFKVKLNSRDVLQNSYRMTFVINVAHLRCLSVPAVPELDITDIMLSNDSSFITAENAKSIVVKWLCCNYVFKRCHTWIMITWKIVSSHAAEYKVLKSEGTIWNPNVNERSTQRSKFQTWIWKLLSFPDWFIGLWLKRFNRIKMKSNPTI